MSPIGTTESASLSTNGFSAVPNGTSQVIDAIGTGNEFPVYYQTVHPGREGPKDCIQSYKITERTACAELV